MNGVRGESRLRTDPLRKEQKLELIECRKNGTEEDEWHQGPGERTGDGSAEKRAKIRGYWAQGEGKEVDRWRQVGEWTADRCEEK